MSASLEVPLDVDHAAVFFWTDAQIMIRHGLAASFEEVGQMLGHDLTLSDDQRHKQLNPLRRQIRAAVVKHARQREKLSHSQEHSS